MSGPKRPDSWRINFAVQLAVFVALIVGANYLVHWFADALNLEIRPSNEDAIHRIILISAVAYTLLLAIPFVPGVEIAIGLIVALGPKIVWLVYLCTVAGLSLSYIIGRLVPLSVLVALLETLHLNRGSDLLRKIQPLKRKERLEFLLSQAPNRYVPFLLKHRHIALALAINLPGNFLIGGGGGIAMIAGLSGLFSVPGFAVTIGVAVLPVPLAVHFLGVGILTG